MDKINFQNGVTPVNANTFNTFQNNIEKSAVIVSKNEPTTNEKVWFKKGKNLLRGIIPGYEFSNSQSGDTNVNENWFVTEFVPVEAGKEYYVQGFSNNTRWWFDENKNFISFSIENPSSAPSNAKYIRLNGEISSSSNMMIFQGNAETIYEPYIEPKIYIKNNNDVYEEFQDNKQLEEFVKNSLKNFRVLPTTNFNYIFKNGIYWYNSSCQNIPDEQYGVILVFSSPEGDKIENKDYWWTIQVAFSTNNNMYIRTKAGTNEWPSWNKK